MSGTMVRAEADAANVNDEGGAGLRRDVLSVKGLRYPREGSRFMLALVPSVATLVVVPFCIYAAAGVKAVAGSAGFVLLLLGSVWVLIQIHRARLLGGAIRVTSASFPEVQAVVEDVCHRLDYRGRLEVWIVEKVDGQVTLTSYLGTKMILVEGGFASDLVTDDRRTQLTFLIARFVGALKAKHLRLTPLLVAIASIKSLKFLNIFILPYERTIVYSGDQIGLACAGSLGAGLGVINRLLVGKEIAPELGAQGVLKQADEARRGVLPRLAQLTSPYPHLTNRYLNLLRFGEQFDRRDYQATIDAIDPQTQAELDAIKPISRGRAAPWLVGVPSVVIAGLLVAAVVSGGRLPSTGASTSSPSAPTAVEQSALALGTASQSVGGASNTPAPSAATTSTAPSPNTATTPDAATTTTPAGTALPVVCWTDASTGDFLASNNNCDFTNNTFYEYYIASSADPTQTESVNVWSSQDQQYAALSCTPGGGIVDCTGSNGEEVQFSAGAVTAYSDSQAAAYAASGKLGPNG